MVESSPVDPTRRSLEVVERKGIGHPDTLCDRAAEAYSRQLSRYYLERAGRILHHNVDKALLVAGQTSVRFGGGEWLAPIFLTLAGRATTQIDDEPVPTRKLAQAAIDETLAPLRYLDPRQVELRVAGRPDLSKSLHSKLTSWVASLRVLRERPIQAGGLETARGLLREADQVASDWFDSRALVYYLAASIELHRFVASERELGVEVAEAYYLLGLIESRIGHSAWLSQAEVLLEAAIRTAPGAPFAPKAYALLEEILVSGHTGSMGSEIPSEIRELLDELRVLLEEEASGRDAAILPLPRPGGWSVENA